MNYICIINFFIITLGISFTQCDHLPEQIHLSLGAKSSEMMVTFTVFDKTKHSRVEYNKIGGPVNGVDTEVTHFVDKKKYKAYIHRAKLTGLEPGRTYEYKCGSDGKWSDTYSFRAITNSTDTPIRFAIYGDLGLDNGVSIPQLKTDVKNGAYDSIFHIGDIAYNLNKADGTVGDEFMKKIEPIAANVPYQVCPGNHEDKRNFTHYLNRFSMIDSQSGQLSQHYYSFDFGSAHFIAFSSELYFWSEYFTESHTKWQFDWIENDLKIATQPANRAQRPWIITLAHRPMYCVEDNDKDCFNKESILRKGRSGDKMKTQSNYGLEALLHKYGVDIEFYGHKHIYERSYPLFDFNVIKNKNNTVYDNPTAPVHIITGVAGTTDRPDKKIALPEWAAFYARDYGFTRMNIQNKTHIFIEQFSVEQNKVIDSFVVKKDKRINQFV